MCPRVMPLTDGGRCRTRETRSSDRVFAVELNERREEKKLVVQGIEKKKGMRRQQTNSPAGTAVDSFDRVTSKIRVS